MHFTERPINFYKNQLIFRHVTFNSALQETIFPHHKRTIICSGNFDKQSLTQHIKQFHNGKQTAIFAPEDLLQLIQEVCKDHSSNSSSHFVITQNMVEDVTSESRQDTLIKKKNTKEPTVAFKKSRTN